MAAPTVTTRTVPAGPMMNYGMRMTVAFSVNPSVNFAEVDPMPFGWDGGEKTDITTMFNLFVRTFAARFLQTNTDVEFEAAYNPGILASIQTLVNADGGSVSFHFPDKSAWAAYGYLQKFVPDKFEDGKQPRAKATVVITNYDKTNGVEAIPIYQAASGTP